MHKKCNLISENPHKTYQDFFQASHNSVTAILNGLYCDTHKNALVSSNTTNSFTPFQFRPLEPNMRTRTGSEQ